MRKLGIYQTFNKKLFLSRIIHAPIKPKKTKIKKINIIIKMQVYNKETLK